MSRLFRTGLAGAILVLAGCATLPASSPPRALAVSPATPQQTQTSRVFLGELALQRGDFETGIRQYALAAKSSADPSLSRFATLLAYQHGDNQLALDLNRHWLRLAPADTGARLVQAVLNTRLGNRDAAVAEFLALLQNKSGENLLQIGALLGQETAATEGIAVMQKLVADQPTSAQAHLALAQLAMHYHNSTLAASEAQRALQLQPGWDDALVLAARALLAAGRRHEARQMLAAQVKKRPDDPRARLAYAAVLTDAGQLQQARSEFLTLLKLDPSNSEALYALGLMAMQKNEFSAAGGYFKSLLKTGRRQDDARYFLGNVAELAKHYAQALRWYRQVMGGRNWFAAQISIARVLISEGKPEAARHYIDRLAGADPDSAIQFRVAEARLFMDSGDNQAALQVFDQALRENPDNTDLLYARALLQDQAGASLAAESDLRKILVRQPDNAAALNALGYILTVHSKQYQEARTYIEKALQLSPDDPAIIDSMGWVEYRLGNYQRALVLLRKSYARQSDPDVAAHLVEVLWVTGDRHEAYRIWNSALKQNPGNAALLKLRRRFSP